MTLVVESSAENAATIAPMLRQVVHKLDPTIPVFDTRTMQDFYAKRAVKTPNMIAQSVAGLGTLGFVLAMVGLNGLISYSVGRRRR
jgi:hypothetical protein